MDDRPHLEQMLAILKNRLQFLEQQEASFGLYVPPFIKLDLMHTRTEIKSIEARLAQLSGQHSSTISDNLPRSAPIFVGRQREIARSLEALSSDERGWGLVIDGIGGIGKTALALEVAHRVRKAAQFDAYLFCSAKTSYLTTEGVRQETLAFSSLDAFVREFARLMGHTDIAQISNTTERRRALLDSLRGHRSLLIWDNLETLNDEERGLIAEFLRKLPGENKAIVTSRRRSSESAVTIRLDRLSEREALDLMDGVAHRNARVKAQLVRGTVAMKRGVYEAAGGNPLVLHMTLGLVAQKGYSLDTALARLRDPVRSSDLYGFLFADAIRDLQENDRAILSALVTFQTPASVSALSDISGLPNATVELAIEKLVTLSLVNDLDGGTYGLHSLTRAYVQTTLGQSNQVVRTALTGLQLDSLAHRNALRYWVDYARTYGYANYQTYHRLEDEWPNLEATAAALRDIAGVPGWLKNQQAGRLLNDLSHALRTFLSFRGYWDEQVNLGEWAYAAAEALSDYPAAGWRAYDVAWIHFHREEIDRAAVWTDRMVKAMERGGSSRERTETKRMRGLIAEHRGDFDEAERLYQEVLATDRARGSEEDIAVDLHDLADLARQRENYEHAESYCQEALKLAEKIRNREYQAIFLNKLGLLALDREHPIQARSWFEQGLDLAREVGNLQQIACAQKGLARVMEADGCYREALALAEEALRIHERLRHSNLDETRQLITRLREQAR
jgi:tetratricopeptide (TPR) repeat protein